MYRLLPKRLNILFLRGVLNNFDMGKKKDPGQVHSCKKKFMHDSRLGNINLLQDAPRVGTERYFLIVS